MRKRPIVAAVLGLAAGLVLGATLQLHSQSQKPSLASLSEQKAEISKMDWLLLKAQIGAFQWMIYHDLTNPVVPMSYWYDPENNRIISSQLVRPEWYREANLEQAKVILTNRAATYCVEFLVSLPIVELFQIRPEIKSACTVNFYTLATGESGELGRKDIATYQDGQLILK